MPVAVAGHSRDIFSGAADRPALVGTVLCGRMYGRFHLCVLFGMSEHPQSSVSAHIYHSTNICRVQGTFLLWEILRSGFSGLNYMNAFKVTTFMVKRLKSAGGDIVKT